MLKKRIIPALLLKDGRMVKGKQFENYRDVGNPVTVARVYNSQKVDELVFLDIDPTEESKEIVENIIRETAKECFMPLTLGGGVKDIEDFKRFLNAGADKVSMNTASVTNPELIEKASLRYGKQCVVISVDYRINDDGKRIVYINSGKTQTELEPMEHIRKCIKLGAGEIFLTSIDHEGMMNGYDFEFLKEVAAEIDIPLIASGGAGKLNDFYLALTDCNVSAVSAGSIFHFHRSKPHKDTLLSEGKGIEYSDVRKRGMQNYLRRR